MPSQNSAGGSGPSPRSNPVCLEVGVTIRSLPGEMGALSQPVREEARTVIVFDNGAVVRSTSNLLLEQKVILSNPAGRDVVCRVAAGRNMPNLKGYVELEFLEPVNDFWNIHQSATPAAGSAPGSLSPAQAEIAAYAAPPSAPAAPRTVAAPEIPAKQIAGQPEAASTEGSGPNFDDIPGLISMPVSAAATELEAATEVADRETNSKNRAAAPAPPNAARPAAASRRNTSAESQIEARETASDNDILSIHSPAAAPARDFMSKGLMAYEQAPAATESNGRKPLIIGVAAVVLVGIGALVYLKGRDTTPDPAMNMSALTHPTNPLSAAAPTTTPPPASASAEATTTETQSQTPPEPISVEPAQSAARSLTSAIVSNAGTVDSHADSRSESQSSRRPEKSVPPSKPAESAPSRRPAIPNLKMSTPSAPNSSLANASEVAAPEAAASATPAGLLTASGRASNPPIAPPSAPAPIAPPPVVAKVIHEPTLLSSTRPEYPATAKASRVQGDVNVLAEIDASGKVTGARALTGPLLLRQAAVDSVRQWKYAPGTMDGKPTPSQVTVNITFRMN